MNLNRRDSMLETLSFFQNKDDFSIEEFSEKCGIQKNSCYKILKDFCNQEMVDRFRKKD